MWRSIDRVFALVVIVAGAAALFVVAAVVSGPWRHPTRPPTDGDAPGGESGAPLVELRVGRRVTDAIFDGQPVAFNVSAQHRVKPRTETTDAPPARHLLQISMTSDDGAPVLADLNWPARMVRDLLPSDTTGTVFAQLTYALDAVDLAVLPPGRYHIDASYPETAFDPTSVRTRPLVIELAGPPTNDEERAVVQLAIAEVAKLRGDTNRAADAAERAVGLDPTRARAMLIAAEAHEEEGGLEAAIDWYERYLAALSLAGDERTALEDYVAALRTQME